MLFTRFLKCFDRGISPIAEHKFGTSARGDILFAKKAPETIAPAMYASGISDIRPSVINTTPIVEMVVNDEPIVSPSAIQIMNAVTGRYFADIILYPYTTTVGMVPAAMSDATSVPMSMNIISGTIPGSIPFIIPLCMSSHENPFILPHIHKSANTSKIGTCGGI